MLIAPMKMSIHIVYPTWCRNPRLRKFNSQALLCAFSVEMSDISVDTSLLIKISTNIGRQGCWRVSAINLNTGRNVCWQKRHQMSFRFHYWSFSNQHASSETQLNLAPILPRKMRNSYRMVLHRSAPANLAVRLNAGCVARKELKPRCLGRGTRNWQALVLEPTKCNCAYSTWDHFPLEGWYAAPHVCRLSGTRNSSACLSFDTERWWFSFLLTDHETHVESNSDSVTNSV